MPMRGGKVIGKGVDACVQSPRVRCAEPELESKLVAQERDGQTFVTRVIVKKDEYIQENEIMDFLKMRISSLEPFWAEQESNHFLLSRLRCTPKYREIDEQGRNDPETKKRSCVPNFKSKALQTPQFDQTMWHYLLKSPLQENIRNAFAEIVLALVKINQKSWSDSVPNRLFVHGDLHLNNIGMIGNRPVINDFGHSQIVPSYKPWTADPTFEKAGFQIIKNGLRQHPICNCETDLIDNGFIVAQTPESFVVAYSQIIPEVAVLKQILDRFDFSEFNEKSIFNMKNTPIVRHFQEKPDERKRGFFVYELCNEMYNLQDRIQTLLHSGASNTDILQALQDLYNLAFYVLQFADIFGLVNSIRQFLQSDPFWLDMRLLYKKEFQQKTLTPEKIFAVICKHAVLEDICLMGLGHSNSTEWDFHTIQSIREQLENEMIDYQKPAKQSQPSRLPIKTYTKSLAKRPRKSRR